MNLMSQCVFKVNQRRVLLSFSSFSFFFSFSFLTLFEPIYRHIVLLKLQKLYRVRIVGRITNVILKMRNTKSYWFSTQNHSLQHAWITSAIKQIYCWFFEKVKWQQFCRGLVSPFQATSAAPGPSANTWWCRRVI